MGRALAMRILTFLWPVLASAITVVPLPDGPFGVSLTDLEFTQSNRSDPYTHAPNRKLILSLIEPTGLVADCQPVQQMYMPNTTAAFWEQDFLAPYNISLNNTFSRVALSLCKPVQNRMQYPLVFFSPGLSFPRQFYHILATNIAAQGFTVVTIDVPGENTIQTFLDGTTEYGDPLLNLLGNFDVAQAIVMLVAALDVRTKDISFILDRLASDHYLNTSSAAIFGHSSGGETALIAMEADPRFAGGCNLDGILVGKELQQTSDKPFLIFGHGQHNQTNAQGWTQAWNSLLGPKWQLELDNSTHRSFTDIPIIAEMLGLYSIPGLTTILGSIDPQESLKIQTAVLSNLAGYILGSKTVESVLDIAESSPEVTVYNASDIGN